ncbi:ThiF family adenylyltransferase [Mesorhizobium sp. M1365]|uniref:ThiF family adenylyltransferase n=1 Tax=Mesorhizobium sp. M1365 TaxID=2957090 RepID=UPI0033363F4C
MTWIGYGDLKTGMLPHWEHTCVGRLDFELRDLAFFARDSLRIDEDQLKQGVLSIKFEWPLASGEVCQLRAVFPDSYPFVRPQVALRGNPETFPHKHCSPTDGNLCLLGRDTGLWSIEWTLAKLLEKQLANALNGTGMEDPQGEPMEFWWNAFAPAFDGYVDGSFMLIDTAWNVGAETEGTLRASYSLQKMDDKIRFQGVVEEIKAKDGSVLAARKFPLPPGLQLKKVTGIFPWRRVGRFAPPSPEGWRKAQGQLTFGGHVINSGSPAISMSVTVQSTELSHRVDGDTWLFPLRYGPAKSFRAVKQGQRGTSPSMIIVPTLRAGATDIGARVPSVGILKDKVIAIFGMGAIGAPVAIELARNGCSHLTVIDHDIVEPGNSIRWPLGATAWGMRKTTAVKHHVESEYPSVEVEAIHHTVGIATAADGNGGDHSVLPPIFGKADIVIDATASSGISRLLADHCKSAGKPMISLFGTLSLKGGVVAAYQPKSGCPTCREFAYAKGLIEKAPGSGEISALNQPAGCAELTFTGASFDLHELSLEAVRLTVDILSQPAEFKESLVHTLTLHDGIKRVPPSWRVDGLPPMKECGCNQ